LDEMNSGTYRISGYITDLSINEITTFYISDNYGKIKGVIFERANLIEGKFVEGDCILSEYKGNKECIFNELFLRE